MILLVFCKLNYLPVIMIHALLSILIDMCIVMVDFRYDGLHQICIIELGLIILILISPISFY